MKDNKIRDILKAFVDKWNTTNNIADSPVIYDSFVDEFLKGYNDEIKSVLIADLARSEFEVITALKNIMKEHEEKYHI
jgi:hypothetical protein